MELASLFTRKPAAASFAGSQVEREIPGVRAVARPIAGDAAVQDSAWSHVARDPLHLEVLRRSDDPLPADRRGFRVAEFRSLFMTMYFS